MEIRRRLYSILGGMGKWNYLGTISPYNTSYEYTYLDVSLSNYSEVICLCNGMATGSVSMCGLTGTFSAYSDKASSYYYRSVFVCLRLKDDYAILYELNGSSYTRPENITGYVNDDKAGYYKSPSSSSSAESTAIFYAR